MKNVAAAFVKAKRAFSPALKDKTNPAFRSKYADLGACLEAVNDALLEQGIALTQRTHPDESGVTIETILMHESGEFMSSGTLHVPASKQDPQGYGSALTYARRYSLMAACGIAPEDDDGNAAVKTARTAPHLVDSKTGEILSGKPLEQQLADSIEHAKKERGGVMGAVLPAVEAYLDSNTKGSLMRLAKTLIEAHKTSPTKAGELLKEQGLNGEEEVYLFSMLPSNVRSAIKKEPANVE